VIADPIIIEHEGILVVRDDVLSGGTKRRAIHALFNQNTEYVYPSPVYGYAQVALAYAARDYGKRATIFCAKRKVHHPLTIEAEEVGAKIIEVPHGYLNVVKYRARDYCGQTGATLLPFGLDDPRFILALADVARALPVVPKEVWSIVGSGVLSRALQLAWPDATFYGVRVGAEPDAGHAIVYTAPELYEHDARELPPFPSCKNYDAKAWRFIKRHATPGALFWNVAK
jgi:hypothetical protein